MANDNAMDLCESSKILNNLPSKIVLGSVAGAVGGVGGLVTSIVTMP